MLQRIPTEKFGSFGEPMAEAVRSCVHCGFCLSACPTYRELGEEMDSPRGRIILMKEVLEGGMTLEEAAPYVDRCLGCLACEPACPSGVEYRNLLSPFRAVSEPGRERGAMEGIRRALVLQTLPHPGRFRLAVALGRFGRVVAPLMPARWRAMLDLLPRRLPAADPLEENHPAAGDRRGRVALLAGCVQPVLAPGINRSAIAVLNRCGIEVVVPRGQGCCGALAWHVGEAAAARACARRSLEAFSGDEEIDAVVTTAAGCGSGMQEYGLMLAGTGDETAARDLAGRVVDVCEFLERAGVPDDLFPERGRRLRVAYHDACHLANAQGVRDAPRALLRRIPGLELIEIPEGHLCCGSAGTYNVDQPGIAAALGREKAMRIIAVKPDVVVTGNIGCLVQVRKHLKAAGSHVPAMHTIELAALAMDRS